MSDTDFVPGQLDIFHQPPPDPVEADEQPTPRSPQLAELPGETFEDIFRRDAA